MSRLYFIFVLLFSIVTCGVFGFSVIEGLSPVDALYTTIITISTVGFNAVGPLTTQGKIFTIILILTSVGAFTYALALIADFIIEGKFEHITRRIRMEKNISALSGHYIVCGANRIAAAVIKDFEKAQVPIVVIDQKAEEVSALSDKLYIAGDPTDDDVLIHAKITEARGLVSCLEDDKENLFVVISARSLNAELNIVSAAKDEASYNKMLKAGANNVILPDVIGARRMASMILQPSVLSFLDVMTTTKNGGLSLKLEEICIPDSSHLVTNSLAQAHIPQETGMLVVAIKKGGQFIFNPSSSTVLHADDVLIVLGADNQIAKLQQYVEKK